MALWETLSRSWKKWHQPQCTHYSRNSREMRLMISKYKKRLYMTVVDVPPTAPGMYGCIVSQMNAKTMYLKIIFEVFQQNLYSRQFPISSYMFVAYLFQFSLLYQKQRANQGQKQSHIAKPASSQWKATVKYWTARETRDNAEDDTTPQFLFKIGW